MVAHDSKALEHWIINWIVRELDVPEERVNPQTKFRKLGMASLQIVDLSVALEDHLGVEIEPGLVMEYPTIAKASAFLSVQVQ